MVGKATAATSGDTSDGAAENLLAGLVLLGGRSGETSLSILHQDTAHITVVKGVGPPGLACVAEACDAGNVTPLPRAAIVYVDERLVVLNKPAGVSLATRRIEPHAAVARLLATLPASERESYGLHADDLLLAHRLDVGTSGLVLLARDAEAHRELVRGLSTHRIGKTYIALVWGRPRPRTGQWVWPLGPNRDDRRRMRVDPAGRRALTSYHVLAAAPHVSLLALTPYTGRTHQLRVHLAYAGHPIVGDDLYGGPRQHGVRDAALRRHLEPAFPFLHAWRLELPAGVAMAELRLQAELPEPFAAALATLAIPAPA